MGDHSVSLKVEFEMHGVQKTHACWVNWTDQFPENIANMIRGWSEDAFDAFHETQWSAEERQNADIEKREREEFARLKQKYEPTT